MEVCKKITLTLPYDKPTLNTGESLFKFKTDELGQISITAASSNDIELIASKVASDGFTLDFNMGIRAEASWAATYNQRFEYDVTVNNNPDTALENRKIKIIIQGAAISYDKEGILFDPNMKTVRTNSPIDLSFSDVSSKGKYYAFATRNEQVVKIELRGTHNAHWRYIDAKGNEQRLMSAYVGRGAIIYASKLWLDQGYDPTMNSATYDITVNDKISTIITYTK